MEMTYCVPETSLDQIAHWLLSITKHDNCHNDTTDNKNPERFFLLQQTREYSDFIQAARRLEGAHRNLQQTWNKQAAAAAATQLAAAAATPPPANYYKATGVSFLQHVASDDVLVKIFGFLESQSLVHVSATCTRCYSLAHQSAHTRTRPLAQRRQLTAVMQLLRAHEQLCGARPAQSVRIPTLLLPRRVQVSNAGDPEYNGVYYCTGCNGNGFLFSKPRGVRRRSSSVLNSCVSEEKPLRCIIAKRFSNETILWYLSKEVISDNNPHTMEQVFSFWAKLMVIGDASPDICRYPSQTSILNQRDEGGWQTLSTTRDMEPPIVELL